MANYQKPPRIATDDCSCCVCIVTSPSNKRALRTLRVSSWFWLGSCAVKPNRTPPQKKYPKRVCKLVTQDCSFVLCSGWVGAGNVLLLWGFGLYSRHHHLNRASKVSSLLAKRGEKSAPSVLCKGFAMAWEQKVKPRKPTNRV